MPLKMPPISMTLLTALLFGAAPAMAQTAFDGPYVGAVIGLQTHSANRAATNGTPGFLSLSPGITPANIELGDNDGLHGGALAGWNLSSGNFVYGAEADILFGNIRGSGRFSGAAIPGLAPDGITTDVRRRIGTRGSLRARLGTTLSPGVMIYGTGGVAFGDTRASADVTVNGVPGVGWSGVAEKTRWGWTAGAGAEFKLTSMISLRAEYLFTDLGRSSVVATGNSAVRGISALDGIDYDASLPNTSGAGRVGVTLRF